MPPYRIYHRGEDGHIDGPPDLIECDDDAAARDYALERADANGVEVWEGTRLVAVISDDSN